MAVGFSSVLLGIDKSRNYVFIWLKRDLTAVREDLIKFQARNITRENFNFSHEPREEDVLPRVPFVLPGLH